MEEDDGGDMFDCSSPLSKGGLNQIFICSEEGCSSVFSKRSYLEQHMCIHTSERLFVCSNDGCIKSYKRKDHLNRHMKSCPSSQHIELARFPCTVKDCEHKFTTGDSLRKHVRISHATKKMFPCSFEGCPRAFKKHQELKAHEFDHTQKNPFQCPHPGCEMSFRWMNRLKRHMKIHDGYSCHECEKKFEKWTLLLKHKSSAHKVELACPVCTKTFSQQHRLNVHMKVHSEEREVYECPREGCVRYYSEKRNLDAHIRSYHDGSRVLCTHESCARTFAFKHKMLEHLKSHSLTRKIRKKFPKKGHQRKKVVSLLTGIKSQNEAGTKEYSDSDDLLSSNETESFSTTPSCDWGGYSEIWDVVDNTSSLQEANSSSPKAMEIPDENSDHGDHDLTEDLVPVTTNDIEVYKDKWVPNTNCREVPDAPMPKIGNGAPISKSQTNSINSLEVTINSSDDCSLTNTNSEWETTESAQIYKDHFTSTSSSDSHLQVSKNPKLASVTLTGLKNDEIKESDHSLKLAADDQPENDDSMNELQIISCELGPTVNLFKCAPCSQSFSSESLLIDHQSRHTAEPRYFPCQRKNCQNVYTIQRKLDLHLKCDHDGLGFQCKYANCGMVFNSERSLCRHFSMHCVKIRQKKKKKISDIISENVTI